MEEMLGTESDFPSEAFKMETMLGSESELMSLFKIPFEPKRIIYSLNSDFFRAGNVVCKIGEKQVSIDIDDEELLHNPLPEFPCGEHGCKALFTTVHDYEIHYRSSHSIVCTECKKCFPSYNLLDIHIQERHDTYFDASKDKNLPTYSCLVEDCSIKFQSLKMRNEHAIKEHNYPPNFKFQDLKSHKELEKMDVAPSDELCSSSRDKHRKPVPYNICFGRGSSRAFMRRKKQKSSSTDISMKELEGAL